MQTNLGTNSYFQLKRDATMVDYRPGKELDRLRGAETHFVTNMSKSNFGVVVNTGAERVGFHNGFLLCHDVSHCTTNTGSRVAFPDGQSIHQRANPPSPHEYAAIHR